MLSLLKVAAVVAALALRVTAHDGVHQLYKPVSAVNLLNGEPTGKIVKIGALVSACTHGEHLLIYRRRR